MSKHLCNTCIKLPKFEPILGDAITISRVHSYHCAECEKEFMYCCKYCRMNMRALDHNQEGLHENDKGLFCSKKCALDWIDFSSDQMCENERNLQE